MELDESEVCPDCGEAEGLFEDPRDPPVTGDALCRECYKNALTERIDELETELEQLQEELAALEPKPNKRGK